MKFTPDYARRSVLSRGVLADNMLTRFHALLASIGVFIVVACPASAATLVVPTVEYPDIRAAVDAAQAGDTVLVEPGTYVEEGSLRFSVRDGVRVVSRSGPLSTILDYSQMQPESGLVFHQCGRETILDGFTLRHWVNEDDAVVEIWRASPTIRNCRFEDCWSWHRGGAIYAGYGSGTNPLIQDCVFQRNTGVAGAISMGTEDMDDRAEIERCLFEGNRGQSGGAISGYVLQVDIRDCIFKGNSTDDDQYGGGGAIWLASHSVSLVENCILTQNRADKYGGAIAAWDELHIRGSTIVANAAGESGGGLAVGPGDCVIEKCIIQGNCAPEGAAVRAWGSSMELTVICSSLLLSEVAMLQSAGLILDGPHLEADPRICLLPACSSGGPPVAEDLHLRSDSPCLPQFSPCHALIGALGAGCAGPTVGACCDAEGCRLETAGDCAASGGFYLGDEVGCYPDPCVPIPVERTTWGQIKARFR